MNWQKKNYWLWIVLVAFLFVSYFHLGRDWLYDWDEGIYAEIGRELKVPFINLSWNYSPWFEKPFLVPILVKVSFLLFGVNEFAARFFMPLLGLGVIYFTYRIAWLLFSQKIALWTAIFFFFAPLFLSRSRMLNTDIVLLFTVVASCYFFLVLERKIDQEKNFYWHEWLIIAFLVSMGVFAKGIMGLMPLLIWGIYLVFSRRDLLSKSNIYHWLIIGGIVFLFIAPWHFYMAGRFGRSFWQVYFIEQVLRRAYQPIEYHFGGRLYYLKFILKEFNWKLIFPLGGGIYLIKEAGKKKKTRRSLSFLLIWGLLVFFLFTFSKTKLFWYIFPLYPVIAIFWGVFWGKIVGKEYFFLPVFSLFLLWGLWQGLQGAGLSNKKIGNPKNELARQASQKCSPPFLFLVDENERRAYDILPPSLRLSSSFSYGGAPAVVFYFRQKVRFFYRPDNFRHVLENSNQGTCAMINKADFQKLGLKVSVIKEKSPWLLIRK